MPRASLPCTVLRTFSAHHSMARAVTRSFPASFVRGGTSNGLVIKSNDLPNDQRQWQPILSSAMGSPDPFGRQLNGIGQGISSTSKICMISSSQREDVDVDYTFVQVGIEGGDLDMAGNCGNMTSAVGPVAWDEGLVESRSDRKGSGEVTVKMFNTNTSKIIHSSFAIGKDGMFNSVGEYGIDGVSGTGSRITLSFLDPAGAKTGKILPSGNPVDTLHLQDGTEIRASLVDIANPGVFILPSEVGVTPNDITPAELGANREIMNRLEQIREEGARLMGLDPSVQSIPKVVLISRPNQTMAAEGTNIVCRALSMQQAHKAVPLTLALNLGAACRIPGTLPAMTAVGLERQDALTIAHASGRLEVGSTMNNGKITSAVLHRTARVLMKGEVFYTCA